MIEAVSCGGIVVFRAKILLLYKNYKNRYEGWVLPKGTVEPGESHEETALREVREETGAEAAIVSYIGKSSYSFLVPEDTVEKDVHWYLMKGRSYYSRPQSSEYFRDSGYYKYMRPYISLNSRTKRPCWKRPSTNTEGSAAMENGMRSDWRTETGRRHPEQELFDFQSFNKTIKIFRLGLPLCDVRGGSFQPMSSFTSAATLSENIRWPSGVR